MVMACAPLAILSAPGKAILAHLSFAAQQTSEQWFAGPPTARRADHPDQMISRRRRWSTLRR
jgi:hypothetical protein